ncbi:DUF1822 family protein [Leptolyngbya iicbica]|uniref:DUF1822 family protein n=1 Tax=Lyngbya confervoides BDU141951 TaxID=1574623 RepID=A0A0C1Y5N8_9CYAN
MSVVFDNPVQPMLAIPPDLAAWQQCVTLPDPTDRWRTYLHRLVGAALQAWMQEESGQSAQFWPSNHPADVWQLVDGLALTLGVQRIVVVLSETIDAATLQVPQEWVDIPDWVADYYLAAHVDVDEQRLVLWGYTTHAQVKTQGTYAASERTYTLSDTDLIQDFSVFWVAQQLEQLQPAAIAALPLLPTAQAEQLVERLTRAATPRFEIPFEQWGALLSDGRWRRQLVQQRQGRVPVDLGRWVSQVFEPGWRSLESLLPQTSSLAFRAAVMSSEMISRGKRIGLNAASGEFVLVLRIEPVEENRRRIQVQLFPADAAVLPARVTLALDLPETAERLQTVQAEAHDNFIQLPSFRCPPGQGFRVSVQLADAIFLEDFVS